MSIIALPFHFPDVLKGVLLCDLQQIYQNQCNKYLFICLLLYFYSGGSMLGTQPPGSKSWGNCSAIFKDVHKDVCGATSGLEKIGYLVIKK